MLWHHAIANARVVIGRETRAIRATCAAAAPLGDVEQLVTNIRSFCNADLPAMLELWLQHWSSIGPPPRITAAKFEQAILARTFFDPSSVLLAETDGVAQAWCHHAPCRRSENTAVVCALCVAPSCDPDVSQQLLATIEAQITGAGFDRIRVGVVRDDEQGYAGLDPIGHGIGIPVVDTRTATLLSQRGFTPQRRVTRMIASTFGYRPPVSREGLQLRRSSRVQSGVFTHRDSRHASGLSHLDIEHHCLVDRYDQQLASVNLWVSDPEAEVMSPSMVILDIEDAHERGRLETAESYLIGTLIQSLAQRRIDTVETAVDSDKGELLAQLHSLQFASADEGVGWAKSLS